MTLDMEMPHKYERIVGSLFLLLLLAGCSSFGKGVAEAVLERSEKEDSRQCHIEGPASKGLAHLLASQDQDTLVGHELKVLMVHGIGRHSPGYSGRLVENLMPALGLTVKSSVRKEIVLWEQNVSSEPIGRLSVDSFMSPDRSRRLAFYELTWSEVFDQERQAIAFDNSKEHSFRRTEFNGFLKTFFNNHIPDAFIYLSDARAKVYASVQQSFCWMSSGDWEDLPDRASERCDLLQDGRRESVEQDDFVFVTHSLGSRIAIDILQDESKLVYRSEATTVDMAEEFRNREIVIYMLANQLPLLALSIDPPKVQEKTEVYCTSNGALVDQRVLKKLKVYAFSDPNDLLSYPIPPNEIRRYVDSRLCPSVTNISLNVARPIDLFGFGQVANPAAAHSDYDRDERVIEIIAHGVGQEGTTSLLEEGCSWIETEEEY
jgi:hypothetical protein